MLGKTIKYIRKTQNLNQEELGKLIGIARTTLAGYEQEYRSPTFDVIENIANACGYKIYFINEETNDKFQNKDIQRKDI